MNGDREPKDPMDQAVAALSLILLGEHPIAETLLHVAQTAKEGLRADYATITTLRDGAPHTTAATEPRVEALDRVQYSIGSGPCLDSFNDRRTYRIDDTRHDQRWPDFCAAATEAGVRSALALPLMVADEGVGALNLYSERVDTFAVRDENRAERFAEPAAIILTNARLFWEARTLSDGLKQALESRAAIEQAKGIVMANHRMNPDGAFDVLRDASQRQNRKLRDIATDVVGWASNPGARQLSEVLGVQSGGAGGSTIVTS